jgi:hypothetical protein
MERSMYMSLEKVLMLLHLQALPTIFMSRKTYTKFEEKVEKETEKFIVIKNQSFILKI